MGEIKQYVIANTAPDTDFLKLLLWNQSGVLIDEVIIKKCDFSSTDYNNLMALYVAARRSYGKAYEMWW